VNALSGDTSLFAEVDEKYGVFTLKELYELHNQGHKIKVPALLNNRGEKTWIDVENVVSFRKQNMKRITLSRSRLYVELSEDSTIPVFSPHLFSGTEKQIKLKFKLANELKVSQDPRYNNSLLLTTLISLKIPEGDQKEYDFGFTLGFVLAEASFIKRKRKNTKQSLATLNGYAKQKGMTLEEYLNHMTDIHQVQLTVGENDFERKYVDILQKHFKLSKPSKKKNANAYSLYSSDLSFIHFIKEYTEGHTSHDKCVKNEVYNRSWKFLEGILDGYLAGDGHFRKNMDLFEVGITTNYKLRDDLIFLSKALGYDIHLHNGYFAKSPFPSYEKVYHCLYFSISKRWHRLSAFGLVKEHIKSVEDVGEREAYNLVLKLLYSENDTRSVFNHLFFTAYGFLVSDAVKVLERGALSSSLPVLVSSKGLNKEVV